MSTCCGIMKKKIEILTFTVILISGSKTPATSTRQSILTIDSWKIRSLICSGTY